MKNHLLLINLFLTVAGSALAIDNNTVEIVYSGSTAKVTIASNISSYVTVASGTSSHVKLVQNASFAGVNANYDNPDGEIFYSLSGTSTDGEFYLEGSYKCTVELNGLTLSNPSGPAINIQNGKRVEVSAKKGTTNTLSDGANEEYNGCYHCKGHTKFKGKGVLNVKGNSKHAVYSKEYIEVKNLTLNITSAVKDGMHCREYFLMESGTVSISGVGDDGIQVELDGTTSTGVTTDHEDEDTGNFYMTGGTLTISGYTGNAIKTDGTITYSGGTCNFNTSDTEIYAGIEDVNAVSGISTYYDLNGRPVAMPSRGVYVVRQGGKTFKRIVK